MRSLPGLFIVVLRDPSLGGDYNGRYVYSFFCASRVPANNGRLFTAEMHPHPVDEITEQSLVIRFVTT
jgi:hypothetical protein